MSTQNPHFDLSKQHQIYSVVLCGGSGTRLWPLSRDALPKQFISFASSEQTLIQTTINRLSNLSPVERRWIVLGPKHEQLANKQCGSMLGRILVEPAPRNTAPAVAYAAWELMKSAPNAIMAIMSSDHSIEPVAAFDETMAHAIALAEDDHFVVVGIRPTYPATGFGYVELGDPIHPSNKAAGCKVRSFHEKPNQNTAERFLKTGDYVWNAGMFIWKVSTFWKEFTKLQPEMAKFFETASPEMLQRGYPELPKLPIDVAFMEKATKVACVPALFDWNDIGSWAAVRECFALDPAGNVTSGPVFLRDTRKSTVHSSGPFVATVGVEGLVVVATPDAVLVVPEERSQEVREVIEHLRSNNRKELL